MSAEHPRAAPGWAFGYAPSLRNRARPESADVVVAARRPVPPERIAAALAAVWPEARAHALLDRAPIYWTRVTGDAPAPLAALDRALRAARIPVRYVAPADRASPELGPALATRGMPPALPRGGWPGRTTSTPHDPDTEGRWFLREGNGGLAADTARFRGAGTRLAVVDDDAAEASHLELDAEVLVNLTHPPRAHSHGALMVAWAVGCGRRPGDFQGVAPDASPRLYSIPKPEGDAHSLPVAIVRAVSDGADVVLCPSYMDDAASPMLDDALEFAARLGRGGRGAAVVLPTGRDAGGAWGSAHASFSLALDAPASDPRVFCVAPGARGGGWFFWRDRKGRARPFGNRGPAVRWLAPGDDLAYPFATPERLFHAESSGASALAAGALLAVLGANPELRVAELAAVVTSTLSPVDPGTDARHEPLADPADALPVGRDPDGHNAKHGYGAMHATRACLSAADPVAWALVAAGEARAARRWVDARAHDSEARALYSPGLARWAVRVLASDAHVAHGARSLARYARLLAAAREEHREALAAAFVRQLVLVVRGLRASEAGRPLPRVLMDELASATALLSRTRGAATPAPAAGVLEDYVAHTAVALFATGPTADDGHRGVRPLTAVGDRQGAAARG